MNNSSDFQCPSCGAYPSPKHTECEFCGNYLPHLTIFEQRKRSTGSQAKEADSIDYQYFRSLKFLYQGMIMAGIGMAVYIYIFNFDSFSETEMVTLSPVWFLLTIFGTCGLYSEKAIRIILNGEANNFPDGLSKATESLTPVLKIGVYVVFILPFLMFGISKRFSSPLIISTLITIVWAILLYSFLVGIFPSL